MASVCTKFNFATEIFLLYYYLHEIWLLSLFYPDPASFFDFLFLQMINGTFRNLWNGLWNDPFCCSICSGQIWKQKVVGDTVFFIKELILPLNSSSHLSIEWGF